MLILLEKNLIFLLHYFIIKYLIKDQKIKTF